MTCKLWPQCDVKTTLTSGWCQKHHNNWLKTGDASKAEPRQLPPADAAKHAFYGVQVNDNFFVQATGDTLKNRGVEWKLYHYPNGIAGNEDNGFGGELDIDFHQAETYSSYREAIICAMSNYCAECEEFSN
jgi:hypothetical protein